MKILITGSNGLLGQKLVYKLKKKSNIQLIATSLGKNRLRDQEGYIYVSLDVTNAEEVYKTVNAHEPEVIIHTAAMTNVDACEEERKQCERLNVKAVEYLIQACSDKDIHLVHLSTDFIFNGEEG